MEDILEPGEEGYLNQMRVMENGEIYRLKKVQKYLKKFTLLTWIEQQGILNAMATVECYKLKEPPNSEWGAKYKLVKEKRTTKLK